MIVKCLYNRKADLTQDLANYYKNENTEPVYGLIVGKTYVVYALTIRINYMWYYVKDEHNISYPVWKPAPLFDVVDGRLSRYWIYSYKQDLEQSTIAYPEWANDPYHYYDALSDGEDEAKEFFFKYKKLMDVEYPDPSINTKAEILDDKWLMCPVCIDAWESISTDGMVICPNCKTKMHNPRYKDIKQNDR